MTTDELFQSTAWAEVLTATYGFALDRTGGIPYCILDDPAGRRISALPFCDYLPIDAVDRATACIATLRERYPDYAVTLKTRLALDEPPSGLSISKRAVYHRYHPGQMASSSFRRGSRQAIRAGTQVRRSTEPAALNRFQALYHQQRLRKFGGIPQPPSFFAAIHRQFMDAGNGFYLEALTATGGHAATLVVLRSGRGWFYKFGTSDPALLDDRPNNLLFDHLTAAVDEGEADFLDLGLSGSGDSYAGLRRFKASIGAAEHPLTYLSYHPPGYDASGGEAFRRAVGQVTDALVQQNADRATVAPLSECLYRYFA